MGVLTVAPPPTAWQRVAQVPHRAYFSAGVAAFMLLALWWSVALPLASVTAQPSVLVHGLMMPLGIFPPFMLGFVFTAGPRWLGTAAPKGHLPLALGQVAGLLLTLLGFSLGGHWPLFGLFTLLIVWWWATWLWVCCISTAPAGDQRHARSILGAMLAGNVALLATIGWVLSGDAGFWLLARNLILWGWIVPIFLVVAHRMIPFFTQSVVPQRDIWRPVSMLYAGLGSCALLVFAALLGLPELAAVTALTAALGSAYVAWNWAGRPGLRLSGACGGNRLLAMLHLSFAWLPLGFFLQALESAGLAVGTAATHAIGMGFCTTMMVGFVTRVTLGHGGLPLKASDLHWRLYLGLHGVALLRVLLALAGGLLPAFLLHATAALWLLLIVAWAVHVLPLYWKPRADGQPG